MKHIFICADQTHPKCCDKEEGIIVWNYLKARLKELGLTSKVGVRRTKANCLQICKMGPLAVVYPEGVWYHSVTIPVIEKIITEHLVEQKIVEENVLKIY